MQPDTSYDPRLGRFGERDEYHFAYLRSDNDQREVRVRDLTNNFTVRFQIDGGNRRSFVTLDDDQLFPRVANNDEMMAPGINEVRVATRGAVVDVPKNSRSFVLLGEADLHQMALQRVVEESLIVGRMNDENVRFRLRLHVPFHSPRARPLASREETYLTERRTQDDTVTEPSGHWWLHFRADAAVRGQNDAIDAAAVEIAEKYVAVDVRDC